MSPLKSLIKIDLIDSKSFIQTQGSRPETREKLLETLIEKIKAIFPGAMQAYPNGSLFTHQGDAAYVIIDKPTVALRCVIEFMKIWYSMLPSLPDCRAVIDYGEINDTEVTGCIEPLGEPFENITH